MTLLDLPLKRIIADPRAQLRAESAPPDVIADLVELLKSGNQLLGPREDQYPVVFTTGGKHYLGDGFTRYSARQEAGIKMMRVESRPGGLREAILFAASANWAHGRPRSDADRRRAVEVLLADPEWGQWSDRQIAKACQVSPTLVGRVRASVHVDRSNRKATRGGVEYSIDITGINRGRTPAERMAGMTPEQQRAWLEAREAQAEAAEDKKEERASRSASKPPTGPEEYCPKCGQRLPKSA